MKAKIYARTLISILLVTVMLVSSLAIFSASAAPSYSPDYSDPNGAQSTKWPPSEFLALILPDAEISEAEAKYLDRHSDLFLLFNNSFSNDVIDLFYSEGALSVSAKEYSYSALNGAEVIWTPSSASFKGSEISLTKRGELYVGSITATPEDNVCVSVNYTCTLSVPADAANKLINYAYNEAAEAMRLEQEYEAILGEYLESYRAYEQYLEDLEKYDEDLDRYENYLVLKARYEKNLAAYQKYLTELTTYEKDLQVYNKYLEDYKKYTEDKALYEKIYNENLDHMDEYIAYYEKLNKIRSSMYAMEIIYTKPSAGQGSLFTALQNKEMVAMFEKYKDELTKLYGISASTIDHLSEISDDLNETLRLYNEIRERSEREAFEFYLANYEDICTKFNYLYDRMVDIMTPTIFNHICTKMELEYGKGSEMAKYKQWRVTNVLAQIYLICECLDDTQSADGSWSFYNYSGKPHIYYFSDLLSQNVIISDTNAASPKGLSWPENEPSFTLPETLVEPQRVTNPLKPTEVKEPTPPTPCTEPTPPTEVANPGEPPTELDSLLSATDIIKALRSGELVQRAEFSSAVPLIFEHTVSKLVSFENDPVVTVYDYDLTAIIEQKAISSPQDFTLPSSDIRREADELYTYSFEGWSLSPAELIEPTGENLPAFDKDICLYAVYSAEQRLYKVIWITANGSSETYYAYGATPTFDGDLSKQPTQTVEYIFDGWFPMTDIVTEDITYTARYRESERLYSVTWKTPTGETTEKFPKDTQITPPTPDAFYIDGCSMFTFTGWDREILPLTENCSYTAQYAQRVLVSSASGTLALELVDDDYYAVTASADTVRAKELLALAAKEGRRVEISLDGAIVSIDSTAVSSLAIAGADTISLKYSSEKSLSLSIKDTQDSPIKAKGEIRIKLPTELTSAKNFCVYRLHNGTAKLELSFVLSEGYIVFVSPSNADFLLEQLYSITFNKSENGGILMDSSLYPAGASISPKFYPAVGYGVESITITRADTGESFKIDSFEGFVMPETDISVKVVFDKARYTVSFVVNGEIVSSEKYKLGELPTPPEIPNEYEEGEYRYVFVGWTPTISIVTGEVTYIAKYSGFLIGQTSSADMGDAIDGFLRYTVLPLSAIAMISIALLFAGITVTVKLLKGHSKRKKNKN